MINEADYKKLTEHYHDMVELFDVVHLNSSITEGVYKNNLNIKNSKIVSITNSHIKDNRRLRHYNSDILNLLFVGNSTIYKGLPILKEVLMELSDEGVNNWKLDIWGDMKKRGECDNIRYNGKFAPSELPKLFKDDTLLITPSFWMETFSLITLEALSYGVPTLVSANVGAKDVVGEYDKWFIYISKKDLKSKLRELIADRSKLVEFNKRILENEWTHCMENHCNDILSLYNL
ncbi:MAG: glycosyltransferase family 4 protein [bacterium]